ncbi:matrixin family metalloprotease [Microbacterium sp. NEAU-LLC]|uniref:Matrixin family metalloprotease n=2 Tax=Microbacterium helvum TaxID=2773713 RepID=A0ABR8NR85_9MICO|nr:matrixin family metalloprotease [Microbacterium helvum]
MRGLAAVAIAVSVSVGGAPALSLAGGQGPSITACASALPGSSVVHPADVQGLNAEACGLVGKTVVSNGVGAPIPEPGQSVVAVGVVTEGEAPWLQVAVDKGAQVLVSTTPAPLRYAKLLPDGGLRELTREEATLGALAYSRCSDWSYKLLSGHWRPGTLYLNSNERLPSGVSKSSFESLTVASLNTWKNGTNSCGLTRALNVPGSVSYGNWTYDANISSASGVNACTTADGLNVVDFGPLVGTTLGLTCTWYAAGVPVQADIRIDTSERTWVTTSTGCTGEKYDVRSVMTHELGHVLGLDHAAENGANDLTMSPQIANCSFSQRTLGAGDLTGIYVQHGA